MAKGAKRGGKRRRWKPIRSNPPPELILPPYLRSALGLTLDQGWFEAADRALMWCHKRYDAGDRSALLDAVEVLGSFFPAWVREGFVEAWTRYRQYDVQTLDQAFGIKRSKGLHLDKARDRELLRPQIVFGVYCLHAKGVPLDQGLFERVGRELRISTGQVAEIFGEPASDGLRELARNLQISN